MKTFKEYLVESKQLKFDSDKMYPLHHGPDVHLYRVDKIKGAKIYWFDIKENSAEELEVIVKNKKVTSVSYYKNGNADPQTRSNLIKPFQKLLEDYYLL